MFDIITFGSATRDIFLKSKTFKAVRQKKIISDRGLCLPLGLKINVEGIYFSVGGGGTNAAATFVKQGFKTAFCGLLGRDEAGEKIIKELKKIGINTSFVLKTKKKLTNHSVILSSDGREKTILTYRGASGELLKKDIPWPKLKAKWFYLAPLSGQAVSLFENLIDFAKKNKIKVAANPGDSQLSLPKEKLEKILKKIDVLILNQEEASLLTKIPFNKPARQSAGVSRRLAGGEEEIFRKIDKLCPGIAIITKGPAGVVVFDGEYFYQAKALKIKEVDMTGAGDSFASGFISGLIKTSGNIEYAIQLGVANSAACLKEIGAKKGLLDSNQKFKRVKVTKEKYLETELPKEAKVKKRMKSSSPSSLCQIKI